MKLSPVWLWSALGAWVLAATLVAGGSLRAEEANPTVKPVLDGNRAPFRMRFAPDGSRLYIVEEREDALAVLDPAAGTVLARYPTGGEEPSGLALSADGGLLAVCNRLSGSVLFLDPRDGRRLRLIALRGEPYDVALAADGKTAFVALSQLGEVAVVDVEQLQVAARIPVGRHPRALAFVTPAILGCGNTTEGTVSLIDVAAGREVRRLRTPAVNLRAITASPDGRLLYVTAQKAQNERPTETAVGIWSNQVFVLNQRGGVVENIWLDALGKLAADPDDIVLDAARGRAFVACGGGHTVQSLNVRGGGYDAKVADAVGAGPRSLALSPDRKELWVANYLGNDLAVLDPDTLKPLRRVPLGHATRPDPQALGRWLFRTATTVKGGEFSCNSCHTEGGVDAISWKFVHVADGLARADRNVRSLRGPLKETGPFRWTGHSPDLEEFLKEEVHGLLQGPPLSEPELAALADFITSLPLPANPYRNEDDSFTGAARRGQALFEGAAGCAACHGGRHRGGGRVASVGTTPEGLNLDVPHLTGVFDSPPFLHDGRAATLEAIFKEHDSQGRHGRFRDLTPEQQADLLRFVREL